MTYGSPIGRIRTGEGPQLSSTSRTRGNENLRTVTTDPRLTQSVTQSHRPYNFSLLRTLTERNTHTYTYTHTDKRFSVESGQSSFKHRSGRARVCKFLVCFHLSFFLPPVRYFVSSTSVSVVLRFDCDPCACVSMRLRKVVPVTSRQVALILRDANLMELNSLSVQR